MEELITYLDEYIEMKGYKAKSHYLCIKKWVVDAVKKQSKTKNTNTVEELNGKITNDTGQYKGIDLSQNRAKWTGEEIDDTGLI